MSLLSCKFCFYQEESEEAEVDSYKKGFWCSACDGYNYFSTPHEPHRFTLILEDKSSNNAPMPKPKIKLNKRLSPLRYPGGKSKLADYILSKIQLKASKTLVSPYAGGASAELALLEAGVIEHLILNDLDFGIYSLFWTIQNEPFVLIDRINNISPTHKEFFLSQELIRSDYKGCTIFEAAWATLLVNRLAYSGIYRANPLGGRNGNKKGLLSRWNPNNLIKRIEKVHAISDRYTILNLDACELIEKMYWKPHTTILIDPPYVQQGKQLYRCFYQKEDHLKLNFLLESLYQGFPGADIILCYDNDPLIQDNYILPAVEKVSRVYSI